MTHHHRHKVYLNGAFIPLEAATVSVLDRGFIFGEGIYEMIPVYHRHPFRLAEHLRRLDHSLQTLGMTNPHGNDAWQHIIDKIIADAPWSDQSLYIQVTRGADTIRHHIPAANLTSTVFLMSNQLETPSPQQKASGVKAISLPDIRWLRCDLKTTSLVGNCWLRQQAVAQGCAEAVLFRDGILTEGSASNIFVLRQGRLLAPPKNHLILPGITYDLVLELAARHGLPTEVRAISEKEVRSADELWLTSSSKEVLSIVSLDGQLIGDGRPGPQVVAMDRWFQSFKAEYSGEFALS